ncbi:Eco57I restriction-modification methylase domain-containing protein [Anaerobiospirillum succiniciproducens]|uniref:Eco57I restriction-modification methylase domain-containing protein n=1 Tax=Anaerobiospirillum succiniciproducens TaxID=13335 RepID=UPI003F8C5A1D
MAKSNNTLNSSCTLEGVLFLPDHLQKALQGNAEGQSASDYAIPKGLDLKNEMSRGFQIAMSQWSVFKGLKARVQNLNQGEINQGTKRFVKEFLHDVLLYNVEDSANFKVEERIYPLSLRASKLPLIVAPFNLELDKADAAYAVQGGSGSKKSPFQLAQELLNASVEDRWALATNGITIRLLRDSTTLTRPSYLEFNLEDILSNGRFAEFCQMWRALHYTRCIEKDGECIWDQWVKQGAEEGKRARESLSQNVINALMALGNGFVSNQNNEELREKLSSGDLSNEEFMRQLLRLMYRFIFLFCLEERDLLNTKGNDDETIKARERYQRGYALKRFTEQSLRRRFKNEYSDAWEAVRIVFKGLTTGEPRLALPALGGLFNVEQCPDLDKCHLSNQALLTAMNELRWDTVDGQTYAIDYKNMGSEELGGVYESLLELVPSINTELCTFDFVGLSTDGSDAGNTRKMTSSYYTPDELVQSLLNSALDPVIEQKLAEAEKTGQSPEAALLSMTVIDPAMGSGHFCLGAARRIAMRLATLRSYGASPSPEQFRHALREVIDHCIYGVDLNPLAVELARMALWLEGYEEGKPLSFLDHHLKVGNSLVGVFSYDMLKLGISPVAFTAKSGDDKHVTAVLNKINNVGLEYLCDKDKEIDSILHVKGTSGWLLDKVEPLTYINAFKDIEQTSTDTVDAVMRKQEAYDTLLNSPQLQVQRDRCDLLIAAYMAPKNKQTQDLVPTSYTLGQVLFDDERYDEFNRASIDEQIAFARKVCKDASVFHWPVEFPLVMNDGGFTVVLGNPPWDKPKVEDVKWFAARYPEIANAPTAAVRKKMIEKLSHGQLASSHLKDGALLPPNKAEIKLYEQYIEALRTAACAAKFGHLEAEFGGRFPLTGVGDTNLFAYFAELALSLNNDSGRVGLVLPTILMTGDTTKVFAAHVLNGNMIQLHDFENRKKIFPIDSRFRFSLITIGKSDDMDCVFYATSQKDLDERRRHIAFTPSDIRMMNPNTKTCINIRSHRDMEINRKIYSKVPVLWCEKENGDEKTWDIDLYTMFHGSQDSALFKKERCEGAVPLYIGKFISNFDDRFETFDLEKNGKKVNRYVSEKEKTNSYEINPEYWVDHKDVNEQWLKKGYNNPWVLGFRDVASPTNERTLITSVVNASFAFSNKLPLVLLNKNDTRLAACLMANLNSLVTDYLVRIKAPSSNVNFFILKQTPILPPDTYSEKEIDFIASRVAKLTRNHDSINKVWLTDYPEYPFGTDESRLEIRAELDALYAKKYGLTRDELDFVLDPSEAESPDYPSETFPVLKREEINLYGEFRTRRLVLEAFDKLEKYGLEGFESAK